MQPEYLKNVVNPNGSGNTALRTLEIIGSDLDYSKPKCFHDLEFKYE